MKNSRKVLTLNAFANIQISKDKAKTVKGGATEIVIIEVIAG